jgi:hypothetical protein
MSAHSTGRLAAALVPVRSGARGDPVDDFLSGESGTIGGKRDALRELEDLTLDLLALPSRLALRRVARREPPTRSVLVISVARAEHRGTYDPAVAVASRTSTCCSSSTTLTHSTGSCCSTTTWCCRGASWTA